MSLLVNFVCRSELVQTLIKLHEQYNAVVHLDFADLQVMQKALKVAFEDSIDKVSHISLLSVLFWVYTLSIVE